MAYKKDTDYMALMNAAAKAGDYKSAAEYEKSRNEKIDTEGLSSGKTNLYGGNLDQTDHGDIINKQLSENAPWYEVSDEDLARTQKAKDTVNLQPYQDDSIHQAAQSYLANGGGRFTYKDAPSYTSKYKDKIDALMNDILGSSFDQYTQGGEYAALKDQYTKSGQNAMQDTVGQIATRTGGLASSYAGTAGQQAYNSYMDKLQQAAMQAYDNSISRKRSNLSDLMGLESMDRGQFESDRGQYNTDRNFSYGNYADDLSRRQAYQQMQYNQGLAKQQMDYQKDRDTTSDIRYNDETAYNRQQDTLNRQQTDQNNQLSIAMALLQAGIPLTDAQKKLLGVTDQQVQNYYNRLLYKLV